MSFGMRIEDGQIVSMQDGHMPNDFVGLNASKPTNPGVGDVYKETDTGKEYTCFVANIWSLTNSPVYEEYSNHLGTVDNMMSVWLGGDATGTGVTDAANHKMDLSTMTGDNQTYYLSNRSISPSSENFEFNTKISNLVSGEGGTRAYTIGLEGYHCKARFYQEDEGAWQTYTDDGVNVTLNNILDIVSGDMLSIKNYGSLIMFYVNGVLVATHNTPNFSGLLGRLGVAPIGLSVTTARQISVDYFGWRIFK